MKCDLCNKELVKNELFMCKDCNKEFLEWMEFRRKIQYMYEDYKNNELCDEEKLKMRY